MKIRIITVGKPKLAYAKSGWEEYLARLKRFHTVETIHILDRHSGNAQKFIEAAQGSFMVALEVEGRELTSPELARFLRTRELDARPVSFIIGGPDGLPAAIRDMADYQWSLGRLTLPHDLAMVVTLEALYRASTIQSGRPYHK